MRLNFLILHNVANFSRTLRNIADYVLCFERYAPQHNYLYHKITQPITDVLRGTRFHVIVIDSSALGICRYRPRELWYEEKHRWSFIKDLDAVKFAFPQDDYHQSETLDELFSDWRIDHVYPAVPKHHEMLYPRTSRTAHIETALTGYVDDLTVTEFARYIKPYDTRSIDVAQRVTFYSPLGGRLAQLKGRFALKMKDEALRAGLSTDISASDADRIFGDDWLRFLGNARAVTGAPSGVSVWDPKGEVFDRVEEFVARNPDATFEETEAACFPGQDGLYDFSTISPRLFEATVMRCGQVLIEGDYLGQLKPHEHYVPVREDLSNISDALSEMNDGNAEKRIAACYDALIMNPAYRYSTFANRVLADVETTLGKKRIHLTETVDFADLRERHEAQLAKLLSQTRPRASSIASIVPPAIKAMFPAGMRRFVKSMMR